VTPALQEDAAETLLEGRAGLEVEDGEGCRALHHAAREGRLPIVRLLLARGANVEAKDSHNQQDSWTPLLWAAYIGNLPVAEALLDAGADVNKTGLHHCTPLLWAAGRGNLGLVQLFLKYPSSAHPLFHLSPAHPHPLLSPVLQPPPSG
jgi:ankyrin repeat protein